MTILIVVGVIVLVIGIGRKATHIYSLPAAPGEIILNLPEGFYDSQIKAVGERTIWIEAKDKTGKVFLFLFNDEGRLLKKLYIQSEP